MSKTKNCLDAKVRVRSNETAKRFWFHGAHIELKCPDCGKAIKDDLDGDSINYPSLGGEPYEYIVWCDDCDTEIEVNLFLGLTVMAELV